VSALELLGAAAPLLSVGALLLGLKLGKAPPKGDRLR
jgi:hypothetical protein